jgi:hypothetical protein
MNNSIPPQLPSENANQESRSEEAFPVWAALIFAVILGSGSAYLTFSANRQEFPDGGARAAGELAGALIVLPVLAIIISVAIKKLRSLKGFCIVYASLAALSIIGKLQHGG